MTAESAQNDTSATTLGQEPGFEVDWGDVLEILRERSREDKELRLHIEAAMWQSAARRMRDLLTPPQ